MTEYHYNTVHKIIGSSIVWNELFWKGQYQIWDNLDVLGMAIKYINAEFNEYLESKERWLETDNAHDYFHMIEELYDTIWTVGSFFYHLAEVTGQGQTAYQMFMSCENGSPDELSLEEAERNFITSVNLPFVISGQIASDTYDLFWAFFEMCRFQDHPYRSIKVKEDFAFMIHVVEQKNFDKWLNATHEIKPTGEIKKY